MKKPSPDRKTPTDANSGEGSLHARVLDLIQVRTNFEIGRQSVEFEQQGGQRADFGKVVSTQLVARLALEFGAGFSMTNLKLTRQFYLLHAERIGQTMPDLLQPEQGQRQAATTSLLTWASTSASCAAVWW